MTTTAPTHCPSWCLVDRAGYDGGEMLHNGPNASLIGRHVRLGEVYLIRNLAGADDSPKEHDVGVYVYGDIEMLSIAETHRLIAILQAAVAQAEEVPQSSRRRPASAPRSAPLAGWPALSPPGSYATSGSGALAAASRPCTPSSRPTPARTIRASERT